MVWLVSRLSDPGQPEGMVGVASVENILYGPPLFPPPVAKPDVCVITPVTNWLVVVVHTAIPPVPLPPLAAFPATHPEAPGHTTASVDPFVHRFVPLEVLETYQQVPGQVCQLGHPCAGL